MAEGWDLTFLRMALAMSRRSKDPSTQVGAILVSPDKRELSGGYNGFPSSIPDDPRVLNKEVDFVWSDRYEHLPRGEGLGKYELIIHAEVNAILNCRVRPEGWTLYCTHLPCVDCAKTIAGAGIIHVVALDNKPKSNMQLDKAQMLLTLARIQLTVVTPRQMEND